MHIEYIGVLKIGGQPF